MRKNPVRPLKKQYPPARTNKGDFTLQCFVKGKTYYWTGKSFNTAFKYALTFKNADEAKKSAVKAYEEFPRVSIYLSGPGVIA